jgi:hypothetical protein
MRAEVKVLEYIKTIPEVVNLTKGHLYNKFAPINTGGRAEVFVIVDRYESVPLDRTFADEVNWLRVKVEIVIYGKSYDKTSRVTELIQRAMEQKWTGASDGEIGLEPIELSNTVWLPFRLDYQIMENIREE